MEAIINSYYKNDAKKLHVMVDKILFKLKFDVDKEDFYSLSNEIFVKAIKGYDSSQDFDGFLYSCLMNKFKTEMTRRNRKKRQADRNSISISSSIGEDGSTLEDVIADNKTVESIYFDENDENYSIKMKNYLDRLSSLQREVLRLISIGFSANEIMLELHMSKKQYNDCYSAIHSYRNIEVLV